MTKTNKIGFVGLQPVPHLLQEINALALGVRSVNPKATVKVLWTNSWVDPPAEAEAARALVEGGVDILAFDPAHLAKTAASRGAYVIGCGGNFQPLCGDRWLTGALRNWGPFYTKIAQSVLDGSFQAGVSVCSAKGGNVQLAPLGAGVPGKVKAEALSAMHAIETGDCVIFQGPVQDREGKMRLRPGEKPDVKWLYSMDFFVPGVEGNLPKR